MSVGECEDTEDVREGVREDGRDSVRRYVAVRAGCEHAETVASGAATAKGPHGLCSGGSIVFP